MCVISGDEGFMPKISVIVPAHNEEKYLENTMQSIQQQDFPEYETIVVCNGCTDNTELLARKLANGKTKVISFAEANVSKARNIGAQKAEGELLMFLDADTQLESSALSKVANTFTSEHAIATTKVKPDLPSFKYNFAMGLKNFYNSAGLYHGCSGALICRKEDFDQVDGYDHTIIVKEHRKLTQKLKKHTGKRFTCVDTYVTTSMRRFENWGLTKAAFFWVGQWMKDAFGDLSKSDYEKVR